MWMLLLNILALENITLFRSATPDLMSEDMERERERRRWEEEQAQELEKPVGPVHYEELRQGGEEHLY